jgi:hypothetical protein
MLFYISHDVSLAAMSKMPEFNSVCLKTLENWARNEQWTRRRSEFEEQVRVRVQAKMADELAQKQIDTLQSLEKIYGEILQTIKSGELKFRSYEGAISSLVRLAGFIEELRDKVLASLPSQKAKTQTTTAPNFTPEEARAAVQAVLALRRRRQREQEELSQVG